MMRLPKFKNPKAILGNFDGFAKPGEMVLVLGRPDSGCSTFLKLMGNVRPRIDRLADQRRSGPASSTSTARSATRASRPPSSRSATAARSPVRLRIFFASLTFRLARGRRALAESQRRPDHPLRARDQDAQEAPAGRVGQGVPRERAASAAQDARHRPHDQHQGSVAQISAQLTSQSATPSSAVSRAESASACRSPRS